MLGRSMVVAVWAALACGPFLIVLGGLDADNRECEVDLLEDRDKNGGLDAAELEP